MGMEKHALITGAAGFVGRHLARHLRQEGWRVTGVDARPEKDVHACDITQGAQVTSLLEALDTVTHVFHLAAVTFVPEAGANPTRTYDVNLQSTVSLTNALQKTHPQSRFVFISTSEIYGAPRYLPVDEKHPIQPNNPYAISKAAADFHCAWLSKTGALDTIRMRPFNHSGPGQQPRFVLSSFAQQIAAAEREGKDGLLHVGNLDAARDFSHVADIVRGYALAAEQAQPGDVFNICSGTATSIRAAVERMIELARVPIHIEVDPARVRPVDVPEVCGAYAQVQQATGWTPKHTFEELLTDLLEDQRCRHSVPSTL